MRTTGSTSRPSTGTRPSCCATAGTSTPRMRLIALAPVSRADGSAAYVGLAVSCDGVHFSSLEPLLNCTGGASLGRAPDHPVDGLLRRGPVTHIYVHRDVPGIALHKAGRQPRPRLVRLDVPSWKLADLAREKFRTLEGCATAQCRDARGGRSTVNVVFFIFRTGLTTRRVDLAPSHVDDKTIKRSDLERRAALEPQV